MNLLVAEMRRSLKELDLGLKGELTITSDMEDLSDSLFFDQVDFSPSQYSSSSRLFRFLPPGPSWPTPPSTVCQLGTPTFFSGSRSCTSDLR